MTIESLNILLESMKAKLVIARKEQDLKFVDDLLFGIDRAEQKIKKIQGN